MTERTTTVDVGGQPLFVREWGEPAAPPLVFLHGAGDDGAQAAPLAAALSDAARLVAPAVDPSALEPTGDVTAAMARGLVEDPVAATYPALRESSLPLLLVTAFRDEALSRLRIDPLQRLKTEVPQAEIARVAARGHDLLSGDDGTVVAMIRDWLAAQ
jgi:pimeloyl-ACP methyl ester carboxylesterase